MGVVAWFFYLCTYQTPSFPTQQWVYMFEKSATMENLTALIIEDEVQQLNELKRILQSNHPEIEEIWTAQDLNEAYELLGTYRPNVVFSDIEIKNKQVFELFADIDTSKLALIFTSAHNSYATEAFDVSAVDYLLKPIEPFRVGQALQKARAFFASDNMSDQSQQNHTAFPVYPSAQDKISVTSSVGVELLDVHKIVRCESDGCYTEFVLSGSQRLISSKPIRTYEEILTSHGFTRIHRSHLINVDQVKSFNRKSHTVSLLNGDLVKVARRRREDFMKSMTARGIA